MCVSVITEKLYEIMKTWTRTVVTKTKKLIYLEAVVRCELITPGTSRKGRDRRYSSEYMVMPLTI